MTKRQNQVSRMHNCSYYFIPFLINGTIEREKIDVAWKENFRENKYFLKYIINSVNSYSNAGCRYSLLLTEDGRKKLNIIGISDLCTLEKKEYSNDIKFNFYINEIRLFLFDTQIGFLAFNIQHFDNEDSFHIASKNYHLKKVYNTKTMYSLVKNENIKTLYLLSKFILEKTLNYDCELFFNYNNENEYRSNVLTHYHYKTESDLESRHIKKVRKQLFYLKRNYHHEWNFIDSYLESQEYQEEYFEASPYIHWGITSEAAACITISTPKIFFVGNSFYDNFHSYYLYVYVLALHQKYALYNLLTSFNNIYSTEEANKTSKSSYEYKKQLNKQYKICVDKLIDFRAKHVFAIISESNTYQSVYEKACSAFSLDKLFNDIDEQSNKALASINEKINEQRDKRHQQMSLILGIIAFFGYFSAMVDINECIDKIFSCLSISQFSLVCKLILIFLLSVLWIGLFIKYCINGKKTR